MVPGTTPIRLANFTNLVRMARTLLPVDGRGDLTGRHPALAQERIWSSVCSTAVSEWDCREMSGLTMVYSLASEIELERMIAAS